MATDDGLERIVTGAAAGRASVDLAAAAADGDARSGDAPPTWRSYGSSVSPDNSAFAYIVDDGTGYPRAAQRSLSRKTGVGPMRWVRIPAAGPARTVVHSANGRWLAVEIAPSGGEHHQVWAVTTDAEDDTAYRIAAVQADGTAYATVELVGWDANLVLITATESDGTAHALQVNPKTGATIDLDARVGGHLVDSWKGAALLRVGPRGYRDMLLARRGRVTQLLPNDPGATTDAGAILDQGFAHPSRVFTRPPHLQQLRDLDSVQALVRSDFDAKYARLLGVEVSSGGVRFQVLAERTHCDLEEFAVSNDQSTVALLWNNHGRSELEILSLPDQTNLGPIELPGAVASELSISAAGSLITLTVQSPDSPPRVHLVQTRLGRVTPVDDEAVPTDARPEPIQVEFSARDGMPLSGWLHRPTANPEGPAPTFLYFHGGPEAQARPEYNFFVNGLVAAGYTVFAANVRGSGGFGRLFGHADDRYGRYAGIDDAADCVDFLVDEAVADPDRVFCAGRSYGGYLTLACLTFHPTLFAGGVAICGMSDLEAFYRNTEPWIAVAAYTKYGHPDTDRELLRDLSPIHRIDRIVAPLLVIHGAHDTNVPVSESQRMVEQVVAQGGRAELLMFPDEGHEIVRWENQQTMIRRAVAWSDAIARTEDRP